jgi:hypothetical protein
MPQGNSHWELSTSKRPWMQGWACYKKASAENTSEYWKSSNRAAMSSVDLNK